jgi:hypothetical protein
MADYFAEHAARLQQDQAAARQALLDDHPKAPIGRKRVSYVRHDYCCRRCGEVGRHWQSDCPTVGDPAYDYVMTSLPRGIPSARLRRAPQGSLVMRSSGEACELVPNHKAFREILEMMYGSNDA